jgi:DNA-binding PadR family transcriptional regulator
MAGVVAMAAVSKKKTYSVTAAGANELKENRDQKNSA